MGQSMLPGATEILGTSTFSGELIPTQVRPVDKPHPRAVVTPPAKVETVRQPVAPAGPARAPNAPAPPPPHAQPVPRAAPVLAVPSSATKEERLAAYRADDAAYAIAHKDFDQQVDRYWSEATRLRGYRNATNKDGHFIHPVNELRDTDFVGTAPPTYRGPAKPDPKAYGLSDADVQEPGPPPKPPTPLPKVPDFIAAAKAENYALDFSGVVDASATPAQKASAQKVEEAFRDRYAAVAHALNLNAAQICGVYALETAGQGRVFEQPVDPRTGRAISTALGDAQLLAGNSVDMMMRYGSDIRSGLLAEAAAAQARGRSDDARSLTAKADIVASMYDRLTAMKKAHAGDLDPDEVARTQFGRAIHAANLDPAIGPYLQAHKLAYTRDQYILNAAQTGLDPKVPPSPTVLEAMNLAGPRNGFFMAHPLLANRLTVNFVTRAGYTGNPITQRGNHRGNPPRTAGELMTEMASVMEKYKGTAEYRALAAAFARLGDNSAVAIAPGRDQ